MRGSVCTCVVGLVLGAAAGVHGGKLPVEQEAEPAVGARAELERGRVAPHVQRVAAAAQRPLAPPVRAAAGQARRILARSCNNMTSLYCKIVTLLRGIRAA